MESTTDADVLTAIRRTLDRAEEPLTASKLRQQLARPFRPSVHRLAELLEHEVAAGRLHRFQPYRGKADRYWPHDLTEYAKRLILRTLKKKPSTRTDLKRALTKPAKGFADLDSLLQRMLADGAICEHPPLPRSRTRRLAIGPPDPAPYFKDGVDRVRKMAELLAEAGVPVKQSLAVFWDQLQAALGVRGPVRPAEPPSSETREPEPVPQPASVPQVIAAFEAAPLSQRQPESRRQGELETRLEPGPAAQSKPEQETRREEGRELERLGQRLLEAMSQVEPRAAEGALVSLTRLREFSGLRDVSKAAFDRAAIDLAIRGVVALHRHDYPASLSDEDRRKLVQDEQGNYYIGIALRFDSL